MAGITGGMNYGNYSGSGSGGSYGNDKYQSFNNKSYGNNNKGSSYGNNDYQGGLGMYGDYSYGGKSTLDKYKSDKDNKGGNISNKPVVDITGGAGTISG